MDFSHEDQSSLTEYVHSQFKVRSFNIFVIVFPQIIYCVIMHPNNNSKIKLEFQKRILETI